VGIVTLLTDFGTEDTYVGQMKGVMLSHDSSLRLVDLTHDVPPQAILTAALHLRAAWEYFPAGTTHLVVVDPGVGSVRRAIAARYHSHVFVGPDNGVLDGALAGAVPDELVVLDPELIGAAAISRTFHGRDLFAPAAALIANGAPLTDVGSIADPEPIVRIDVPVPLHENCGIRGAVLMIDRYGNAMTNISADLVAQPVQHIASGSFSVGQLSGSYSDVERGEPVALISSMNTLELAVRDGSAMTRYHLEPGAEVSVSFTQTNDPAS
jgi:S-adenosyl-L-methionine hydrolase (adenosine-forming)